MNECYFDKELPAGARPKTRNRDEIDDRFKWNLSDIYQSWEEWEADLEAIRADMDALVALKGTLASGPEQVLKVYELSDKIGIQSYRLYRYPQLTFDVDQKNNAIQSRLQQVQQVFAEYAARTAWLTPELLTIEEDVMMGWIEANEGLEPYRFPISEVYRNQKHVLDEHGEQILAYGSRFRSSPAEAYRALSTADVEYQKVTLSDGEEVTVTYGEYSNILHTRRNQEDRARAFEALYGVFDKNKNTYAALYNGICQRDWAQAQARKYESTAQAALDSDNVPVSVLETLIEEARRGTGPLHRYQALRKKVLGLQEYHPYDGMVPLVSTEKVYPYEDVKEMIIEAVAPLGEEYQEKMRTALQGGWIDVYENEGKRVGAYSAGCYGVHPYMLLNYTDTLNDVFTLAHELGHTLHTVLSSENQPFATSSYTIFVAEVASTTTEALLLEYLLQRTDDPRERAVLLQQEIDSIAGTFYAQVAFADYELAAHRAVEKGEPITAESLSAIFMECYQAYQHPEEVSIDALYQSTWARIPHFFGSPYYVYQYATCYASSAKIVQGIFSDEEAVRNETVKKYLTLLKAGGDDHPMEQLKKAGVDLNEAETVRAVIRRMDELVTMLEEALEALGEV